MPRDRRLGPEEARRLWKRAAELQVEVSPRLGAWGIGALGAFAILPEPGLGGLLGGAGIGAAMFIGLGGAAGLKASRAAYRASRRRGGVALERLLQLVGVELRPGLAPGASAADRALSSG